MPGNKRFNVFFKVVVEGVIRVAADSHEEAAEMVKQCEGDTRLLEWLEKNSYFEERKDQVCVLATVEDIKE